MSKSDRKKFEEAIKSYKKEVLNSKESARKFLVELGIFTEKGRLRKPYKNLRMPQ